MYFKKTQVTPLGKALRTICLYLEIIDTINDRIRLTQTTRSLSGVGEPGHPYVKATTGTRHTWSRAENMVLMAVLLW